ncbi:Putative cyclin-B3-1 -like protein [Gossypium arboreum]|uniref:Putative cyclin-B3-1-like protein n=1 Tax=Gossypium arboreum TaxID=29729 RepID=A0A0B0P661_GOSAR|nr:Putative cyclin-B3-1 -like protein [Gossypium arboreum]
MASLKLKGKTGDQLSSSRCLKIYSQNENPKIEASTMTKPVVGSKAAVLTTAIDSKGSLKNMTKIKGKRDSSENKIVQRKALSDLSNLTSFVSSTKVYDGSKSMKNERSALLERVSVASAAKTANVSSRRSFKGKERDHLNQGAVVHTSKTESNKDVKTSLSVQSVTTKNSDRKSVLTTSRTTKNPLPPSRKSLPVLKKVNQALPSKAKVCESASHQASYGKNHLSRNRGSDSFVMMATKSGSNSAARILPRSFKPSVKTELRPSNTQRASKSKCSSGLKKQASVAAISSKKDIECTLPANNVAAISSEASQKDLMSNGNSDASINMPDILTRKKAKRRRSYTSLLMTGSKLLEGNGVKEEEKLPGIDKDDNPLEVAQYVDEIYQYYWTTEALNPSLENYMSIQKDITPHMRGILINWLIEVHLKFDLMQETLYLMVTLLDRYLSEVQIKKNEMQLVGLTTLLLASKYEDFWHPRVKDLISISAEAYTTEQMLKMEKLVLKELKFRLNVPTPYVFMLRFIKASQSDNKLEHLAFYLIELCLVEYEALKFKPSLLCASAIYVARCTLQMSPSWTPLLCRHTRYDASEIRHISFKVLECAEMILRFQRAARSGQLKVTFEKYTSHELSQVAMITPLGRLP